MIIACGALELGNAAGLGKCYPYLGYKYAFKVKAYDIKIAHDNILSINIMYPALVEPVLLRAILCGVTNGDDRECMKIITEP